MNKNKFNGYYSLGIIAMIVLFIIYYLGINRTTCIYGMFSILYSSKDVNTLNPVLLIKEANFQTVSEKASKLGALRVGGSHNVMQIDYNIPEYSRHSIKIDNNHLSVDSSFGSDFNNRNQAYVCLIPDYFLKSEVIKIIEELDIADDQLGEIRRSLRTKWYVGAPFFD